MVTRWTGLIRREFKLSRRDLGSFGSLTSSISATDYQLAKADLVEQYSVLPQEKSKYESIEKIDCIPIIPEPKKFNLINGFLELKDFKIKVDNQELSFIQTLGAYTKHLEINFNSTIGNPLFFISSKMKKAN